MLSGCLLLKIPSESSDNVLTVQTLLIGPMLANLMWCLRVFVEQGSDSAEDMAITGAGARLHDQDAPTLLLLYDFEELEGELDFLTHFVAGTFYPAISGTSSMTLGELQTEAASNPWVDLLSGGDTFSDPLSELFSNPLSELFSDPLSEPVTRNVASGGANLLDFLDQPIVDDHGVETYKRSSTKDGCSLASGAQQYISCLKSLAGPREVQIWASNKIHREERPSMGKWDVQSLITSSSDLYGPEKSASVEKLPRHVKFTFKNPVRCRIIWITLRLQRPGSASVNFRKDIRLLSLDEDENPFAQVDRHASFGGAVENEPCIHAKRILVVGSPVKREGLTSSQSSEQLSIRNWLDRAPQMSRFKVLVPIEVERLMDYDLVLEQYLPPASPSLAGFHLDAFSAIKPRVTHSPSSDSDIWDKSVTFLEDRYISRAVLYLQVSALQEPHNMVTIAEYRLPEAGVGTPMYFDFPRLIQSRRVSFKLLGDVTAFADEPSEQDDSGLRAPLVATGLSLSNRIKLYYYCHPYELGKWASLSGV
ncbi:hypothetical protein CUMW_258420 [Citrus unshiu]|uniref:Uncharacterized protein n=1 Tax=Citrus unshiu TaxID=55188 RepID=A0A2H5QTQ7_CITUN|nr:hypothetical protein CUMW_258420 [Citrus unshiu]